MNAPQIENKKGFTIIEVVLVLAIAALIFLMVFIALPALQRNQRDTQRKNDGGRVLTAVNNYESNNRGQLPGQGSAAAGDWNTAWLAFLEKYLKTGTDTFQDPQGDDYIFEYRDTTAGAIPIWDTSGDRGKIIFTPGASCGDDGAVVDAAGGTRKVAIRIALEGGGTYCQSN